MQPVAALRFPTSDMRGSAAPNAAMIVSSPKPGPPRSTKPRGVMAAASDHRTRQQDLLTVENAAEWVHEAG